VVRGRAGGDRWDLCHPERVVQADEDRFGAALLHCDGPVAFSANDLAAGTTTVLERVLYNVVGIVIAVIVVTYPFPLIMERLNPQTTITKEEATS
jgi:hypothetical protein